MGLALNIFLVMVPLVGILVNKWKAGGSIPESFHHINLEGKTVLITGSNTGIGYETALFFAKRGARVIFGARSFERAEEPLSKIIEETGNKKVEFIAPMDLSDLQSVRDFVTNLENKQIKIDILVNNAGVMQPPHGLTKDGFEVQFGTNHLGHFLLTVLLLNKNILKKSARVVNVSSLASEKASHFLFGSLDYKSKNENIPVTDLYRISKYSNYLFTRELQSKYGQYGLTAYSLHPGVILTELGRHMNLPSYFEYLKPFATVFLLKTPYEGAQTSLFAALCDSKDVEPGSYLADCKVKGRPSWEEEQIVLEEQDRLWYMSEEAVDETSIL
ncbi:retinol dehydrogenase [Acrasis kona]|uniref:Retinol dehydrogenase n=1 Tax=Acrasis kona TaxID=1008807 RepID=A0AAW2Z9N5_9EUKA